MCVCFFTRWPACWAYAYSGSLPLDLCIFSCALYSCWQIKLSLSLSLDCIFLSEDSLFRLLPTSSVIDHRQTGTSDTLRPIQWETFQDDWQICCFYYWCLRQRQEPVSDLGSAVSLVLHGARWLWTVARARTALRLKSRSDRVACDLYNAHALRLISRTRKSVRLVSSVICHRWWYLKVVGLEYHRRTVSVKIP